MLLGSNDQLNQTRQTAPVALHNNRPQQQAHSEVAAVLRACG